MEISIWTLPILLSKLAMYVGVAGAIGGIFVSRMLIQYRTLDDILRKSGSVIICLALIATVSNFFLQVGAFSESGFSGMWDYDVIDILWNSNVGDVTLLRTTGLLVAIALIFFPPVLLATAHTFSGASIFHTLAYLLSAFLLARSFSLMGHSAELSTVSQLLLGSHVIFMAWWMGALWPLWRACKELSDKNLHRLMHRFGQYAAIAVAILIGCGAVLGYQLLGAVSGLWTSSYGQLLSLKLAVFMVILLIAAWHKLRLVPALLLREDGRHSLTRSIGIEMLIGISILVITSVLTTLLGPEH